MKSLLTITCILWSFALESQEILFPGLDGIALHEAIREEFRPAVTLNTTQVRDTLYAIIDNEQDSVVAIYSGHRIYLPPGVDPSQWVFMDGSGINLEHVYPQSLGAGSGTTGHTDMHHLYPARVAVNEARANFPFAEIPDHLTTTWYRRAVSMQSIPATDIDAYSESRSGSFEPRESVKGNIARAMFYFYTVYQEEADAEDPDYFDSQRATLCQWHIDDPADDAERLRSARIASYQDGKENPFVLDCTLALRAWCPEISNCGTSQTQDVADSGLQMRVNTEDGQLQLLIISDLSQRITLSLYTTTGMLLYSEEQYLDTGTNELRMSIILPPGIYLVHGLPAIGSPAVVKCVVR